VNKADLSYFKELLAKYQKKPEVCAYCGEPLPFREFVKQYEQDKMFCSRTCQTKAKKQTINTKDIFRSGTEEVIYNYLIQQYPNIPIRHNVVDILESHELDFVMDDHKLVIEYNGTLHYTKKLGEKRQRRTKLNDAKKRKLLNNNGYCLCRLWSQLGLYERPELFNKALCVLKKIIDMCLNDPYRGGTTVDIVVTLEEEIYVQKNDEVIIV